MGDELLDNQDGVEGFGYKQCGTCHGHHLAFSLNADGDCYWCAETLVKGAGKFGKDVG